VGRIFEGPPMKANLSPGPASVRSKSPDCRGVERFLSGKVEKAGLWAAMDITDLTKLAGMDGGCGALHIRPARGGLPSQSQGSTGLSCLGEVAGSPSPLGQAALEFR
jgi:hypothetical protein